MRIRIVGIFACFKVADTNSARAYALEVILTHLPIAIVPVHAFDALVRELLTGIVVLGAAFPVSTDRGLALRRGK